MPDNNNTITFSLEEVREADMKRILLVVYDALKEKGYNPISQIVGTCCLKTPPTLPPITTPAASSGASTGTSCSRPWSGLTWESDFPGQNF